MLDRVEVFVGNHTDPRPHGIFLDSLVHLWTPTHFSILRLLLLSNRVPVLGLVWHSFGAFLMYHDL